MKYFPLNIHPENDSNPYLKEAIKVIEQNTIKKKVYAKGNRSYVNIIVSDDGEVVGETSFQRYVKVDKQQFTKLYVDRFSSFYNLNVAARKVLGYILTDCLIVNKDFFFMDFDEARLFTGYSSNNIIRSGLSNLIEAGICARSTSPFKYYINPLIIFNGNRVTFAESYIKEQNLDHKTLENE